MLFHSFQLPSDAQQTPSARTRTLRSRRGFTLVEGMIAAVILVIGGTGVLAVVFKSYELAAYARHRDQTRAMLTTFTTQFLQEGGGGASITTPTGAVPEGTGTGLAWNELLPPNEDGVHLSTERQGTEAHLRVALGANDPSIGTVQATAVREVREVWETGTMNDPRMGAPDDDDGWDSFAGRIIYGRFNVRFQFRGREVIQEITVARATR